MSSSYLSETEYANRRKELLTLMNQLRSVGAQGELDLPRIAVIGNQSAGKSSVVEAISDQCPSRFWDMHQMPAGVPPSLCPPSGNAAYPSVANSTSRAGVSQRAEVEMMLRRAQLAVLDPAAEIARIMRMNLEELKEKLQDGRTAEFSRNVVCIDLAGPELTDVQFVDLPGIIQNASASVIRLVEDMVVDNIRGNCLILVAIPMTDDIENQKAMTLAREQDPNGLRTIGVLTKPDLLSTGQTTSRALWLDVIMGRKHRLHHGYFCTRQPDDEERANGITATEARRIETEFFANSDPWTTCSRQERLGTDNLVSTLSNCLVQMIADTLPRVIRTANSHLEECRAFLAELPEPPTEDPATHLLTLITDFCTKIRQCAQGSSEHNGLIQKNNTAFMEFKAAIKKTAPGFVAGLPVEGSSTVPNVLTGEDGDQNPADASLRPIYLTDVRETLRKARTRELPGDQTWGRCADECFRLVRVSLHDLLSSTMEHFFSRFSTLKRALWIHIRSLIKEHTKDCDKYLAAVVQMEMTPMTQNDDFLQTAMEKWVVRYKDQRTEEAVVPGGSFEFSRLPNTSGTPRPASAGPLPRRPESDRPAGLVASVREDSDSDEAPRPTTVSSRNFWSTASGHLRRHPLQQASSALPAPEFLVNRQRAPPPPPAPHFRSQQAPSASPAPEFLVNRQRAPPPPAPCITPTASNPFATPAPMTALPGFRPTASVLAPSTDPIDEVLASLARLGYTGLRQEDLGRLHSGDEYETEILLMSGVSYRRIIDNVPGLIDTKFVKIFASDLQTHLIREFRLGQPDAHAQCADYLTEDPAVVTRRADLRNRLNMLESVQKELLDFGNNSPQEGGDEA
ncbi:Interferon-induced GTP-binding protein Mx2 [Mycena venus]|uniref:Interferon-induced GTP-binding protein Mx2 n=1 Tax=Mycena venus TaxID=2733690 RepID=A0A8H6YMA5_9AGAR|nr:Interferon-induced GTP-binding protein Mx2 [Mycena venus]